MDKDELEQLLETLQEELSKDDFLTMILDRLARNPAKSERGVLQGWLQICAAYDPDRVATYWEPFLRAEDPFQREVAAVHLSILAKVKPDGYAYHLVTKFYGQEPTENKIEGIIKKRFLRLFPGYEDDK